MVAKKRLKIINGSPEAVNRKTDNTIANTNTKKTRLHRKLNTEQHESHKKSRDKPLMLQKDKQYSVQLLVLKFFRNFLQFGGFFLWCFDLLRQGSWLTRYNWNIEKCGVTNSESCQIQQQRFADKWENV